MKMHRNGLLLPVALMFLAGLPVFANTITVTNLANSGSGSLRQAIGNAASGDTINFQSGLTGTIVLSSGNLFIGVNLTIAGPGASVLAIQGPAGVFFVGGRTATISDLTIQNSSDNAVKNLGTLTLDRCHLIGNSAAQGGAIYNVGSLTVSNSTIAQNSAGFRGGGIYNGGHLLLTGSTVSGNSATSVGGGIYNESAATITNSTISGNTAQLGAGVAHFAGGLTLIEATIVDNVGAGIQSFSAAAKGTILARNTDGNCAFTTVTSQGYNLSDDATCNLNGTGDQNNQPAGLDSGLKDNGGPTQTIALLPGSNAINKIPAYLCFTSTDQRGVARPQGTGCDIGAYERADFSSLTAKLDATVSQVGNFDLNATLTLGSILDTIDPVTQPTTLQVGPYSVTIPAHLFHQLTNGAKKGSWVYSGTIAGVNLEIQIVPLGSGRYQFKAEGSHANLSGLTQPATVSIGLGIYSGSTQVHF